jgi:hypothetical protein
MTRYIDFFHQLPHVIQNEISSQLGSTIGMSEFQVVIRYRDVAWQLKNAKLASLPSDYEAVPPHLSLDEFNGMASGSVDTTGVAPYFLEIRRQILASEGAWYLENFLNQLATLQAHLAQRQAEEAARQLAQRQAEEAAQLLAQQQAEEAARQLARQQAEEAARQLAQQQAEEAARLAAEASAQQLAQQQAEAAALALAQRLAEEEALREARLALELATAPTGNEPAAGSVGAEDQPFNRYALKIHFIPGPAATAEIEQATVKLKHSIDAAVGQFASDIAPYLKPSGAGSSLAPSA